MTSSLLVRLQGWRDVAVCGSPTWLAEMAPRIIRQLEAEIAAQGMPREATRREGGSGAEAPASPVANGDAPQAQPQGGDA